MNSVKWMLTSAALTTFLLAAPALAQVADDARQVLGDSQKAVNSAEGMTYSVKKFGTGPLKDILDLSGNVKLHRPKGAAAPIVQIDGRWKEPGKKDAKILMTNDGSTVTWLSYNDNTKYQAQLNDAKSQEVMYSAKEFLVTEMANGQAFENMLRMPKVEKKGVEKVGDELCDIIVGTSADGSRVFTYAISATDRIPRRIEMATGSGEGKIAMTTELSAVKPAQFTLKDFDIAKPEGFVDKIMGTQPMMGQPNPDVPAVTLGPGVGKPAPDFKFVDSTGAEHTATSLKGKVIVLQFFGSMFKDSTAGSAELQMLADEMKSVTFVGLACRELDANKPAAFFKDNMLSYTLAPKGDDVAAAMNVKGFPSYVVLNKDGNVGAFFQGNPGKDKLTQAIKDAGGM